MNPPIIRKAVSIRAEPERTPISARALLLRANEPRNQDTE